MTTFSQLVDDMVLELLRPDLRATIASYLNQTIRELHFKPNSASPILYDANRYEAEETIDADGTWLWSIPSATRFQDVEAVYIPDIGVYLQKKNPKIAMTPSFEAFSDQYWYRSGPSIALFGVATSWTAKISYFMFPRTLAYKAVGSRLIQFDADTDSYVLIAGGTPTEAQLELETHWMLQRWPNTLKEGIRAKVWKRIGDGDRARMAYSAFEFEKGAIWSAEPAS